MSASGIRTRADFARAIAHGEAVGCPHMAELLRPAMRGELNLVVPMRDTRMPPLHRMERHGRPVVVIVGDDDYASTGPAGWACAAKLRSWARFAIVHGSGAEGALRPGRLHDGAGPAAAVHRDVERCGAGLGRVPSGA